MEQSLPNYQNNRIPRISKWFSVLVAILPILASYASGIPGFSVADICLVIFVGLSMLTRESRNRYAVLMTSLEVGLTLLIMFALFACMLGFPINSSDVVIRTVRYSFYILVLFTAGKKYLDVATLIECTKWVSFIGSVFIMFQALMYYGLGIVVKGFLPFLPLYVEHYATQDYAGAYQLFNMYRPTSFFLEPAHYARYCVTGIALYLFGDDTISNKMILRIAVCMAGIVLSTSFQGYLLLAIVAVPFLFTRIKMVKSRTTRKLLYLLLIALPVAILAMLQIPLIQSTLARSLSGSITNDNSAIGARMGGFYYYFDLPFINKLMGTGFGNVPDGVWMSSAAYWLYGSGIIVFVVYCYFMTRAFFRLDTVGKYVLLIVGILFFTDDSFYSYMIVFYFSLILYRKGRENI